MAYSSKNLNILLTSQMSAREKARLGYGNQMNKGVLSYENEVFESVFYSRSSDIEDSLVNDKYAEGMHAVPPPMTGIYIPSGPDVKIDESQFTYGPKQSKPSESDDRSSDFNSCESNSSEETLTSMPEPVVNEPKVVSQPKVWSDAPILEEYESDSNDDHMSLPTKEQETPINTAEVKAVSAVGGKRKTVVKPSAGCNWRIKRHYWKKSPNTMVDQILENDVPHKALENKGIVDSGCSRHMTGNKAYLAEYQNYNGGLIAFGGSIHDVKHWSMINQ
ncbi:hypothetical protein Tco_0561471 [Tanacetum coccineum]